MMTQEEWNILKNLGLKVLELEKRVEGLEIETDPLKYIAEHNKEFQKSHSPFPEKQ